MEGGGEADDGGGGEADDGGGAVANSIEVTKAERSDAVNINIRRSDGSNFSVQVNRRWSVESFKSMLAQRCDIPAEKQRLVYRGRILDNERVLYDYGLVEGNTVHLFGGFIPAAASNHTSNTVEEGRMVQSGGSSHDTSDMSGIFEFARIHGLLFQNPNLMPETIYRLMNHPLSLWLRMMYTPQLVEVFERNQMFSSIVNCKATFVLMAEAVVFFELIREMMRHIERTGGPPTATLPGNQEVVRMLRSNFTTDPNSRTNRFTHNPTVMIIQLFLLVHKALSLQIPETPLTPELRDIMENPIFLNQLKTVEAMQRIMALVQSFVYQRGQQPSTSTSAGQTARRTGGGYENFGLHTLMTMFSELTVTPTNSNRNNVGPEELYARQLAQLKAVGFINPSANLEALIATAGNLSAAIDLLLRGFRAPR